MRRFVWIMNRCSHIALKVRSDIDEEWSFRGMLLSLAAGCTVRGTFYRFFNPFKLRFITFSEASTVFGETDRGLRSENPTGWHFLERLVTNFVGANADRLQLLSMFSVWGDADSDLESEE